MNIILLGPPGAGKGTQSRRLMDRYNLRQLSTGDMLRDARSFGTEVGELVSASIDAGEFVADDIVISLIEHEISGSSKGGFIFDGFPRTLGQASALDNLLKRTKNCLDAVIEIQVNDGDLVQRITGRYSCSKCGEVYHETDSPFDQSDKCKKCDSSNLIKRADDNASSLSIRLMEYYKKTSPLIGYYYAKGILSSVNGLLDIDIVEKNIIKILEN